MSPHDERSLDFDAAEIYLRYAREAHEQGNNIRCFAACKMVAVALQLTDQPAPIIHTSHLKNPSPPADIGGMVCKTP